MLKCSGNQTDRGCEMTRRRLDIRAILSDPAQRRELLVATLIAMQAREGITTTQAQAEAAYNKVQAELAERGER